MTITHINHRHLLFQDIALILAAALLVLWAAGRGIDLGRIHLSLPSFNDQVGYISVARNVVETGELTSNIIYPSTLLQDVSKNYFYMPGHYLTLAASYSLFGVGVWQSLLPSLLAYLLTAALTYLIGRRFYDRPVGWLAAALFLLFPPNLIYAFSAMSEMTRVAVTAAAFAVFAYLPLRWRIIFGPWLLIVPFLFRETGALLLAPMALLLFFEHKQPGRNRNTLIFLLYALIILGVAFASPLAAGRPNLVPTLVFDNNFETLHSDALAQQAIASPTAADWLAALPVKVAQGSLALGRQFLLNPISFPVLGTAFILGTALLAALLGVYKRDSFFLAVAALILATLLFVMAFYDRFGYGWLRILLSRTPFAAVVLAAGFECYLWPLIARRSRRPNPTGWRLALLTTLTVLSLVVVHTFFRPAQATSDLDEQRTAWLEQLAPNDNQMLVSSHLFLHYVYQHHPVNWAFVPTNGETLALLAARYPIGTLLLPKGQYNRRLTAEDLASVGLTLDQEATFAGETYLVFRHGDNDSSQP